MAKDEIKLSQVLVNKLQDFGISKWALRKMVSERRGKEISYKTITNWEHGLKEARKESIAVLREIYDEKCRELRRGLYEPPKETLCKKIIK